MYTDIEQQYRDLVSDTILFRFRILVFVGIFVNLVCNFLDAKLYPTLANHFLHVRLASSSFLILLFFSTFVRKVQMHIKWVSLLMPLSVAVSISYMIARADGDASTYSQGLILCSLGFLLINSFYVVPNLVGSVLVVGFYIMAIVLGHSPMNFTQFTSALFFISSMGTLCIILLKFYQHQHHLTFFNTAKLRENQEQLATSNENLARLYREADEQARHDLLTGLFNNSSFHDALFQEFTRAQRHNAPFCLIFIDMDYFKEINDTFGHQGGDLVLKTVSKIIREECRETDVAARYGGDEMALLLPQTSGQQGRQFAERIHERIQTTSLESEGGPSHISASIGVSELQPEDTAHQMVLVRADEAVYKSKELGRGRVSVWDSSCQLETRSSVDFLEKINTRRDVEAINVQDEALMKNGSREWITNRLDDDFVTELGESLNLSATEINDLRIAYILRDIGISGIPDSVLTKRTDLTSRDWNIIKSHTKIGRDLLLRASSQFKQVADAIYYHHEKWNGQGYPDQIVGTAIPKLARIVAVLDAFSAMISERPYHKPLSMKEALGKIKEGMGTHFDPAIAERFIKTSQAHQRKSLFVNDQRAAA